jgi:hypothetical protein
MASFACFVIALAAVGAVAQAQSDEQRQSNQQTQSDRDQRDRSRQENADNQSQQDSSQSDSQDSQQAQQDQQRQQQERERQQEERQGQQQRQRQQQAGQRDEQSRDRDQSSRDDFDARRDRGWPQPDGRDYGSDSLTYRQQPGQGEQQGGLGVGLRSDGREGVVVSHVHSGSPAEEMGIREGDRITAVNGREVQSVQQFIGRIRNMEPGQEIELDIRRARGGDQTVRGELESRQEALAEHAQQDRWLDQQRGRWRGDQYGQPGRDNWQTSYDEARGSYSQSRSGQVSGDRLEQLERQVDQLSRQLDDLRVALQNIRRQSGESPQWDRERTARYDEYQGAPGRRETDGRFDGRETYRPVERERESEREGPSFGRDFDRDEPSDRFDEGPGGEIGSDRQSVGSENLRERN